MDPAYVAAHIEEDRSHWWFRGRLAIIRATLRRVLPKRRVRLLELGCGSGNVLAALTEFGEAVGLDAHEGLAAAARAAGLDVRVGRLPDDLGVAPDWADVVLLLDVIEHVDDDVATLCAARAGVGEGGLLVVSVPRLSMAVERPRRGAHLEAGALDGGAEPGRGVAAAVAAIRGWKRLRGDRGHDLRRPAAPLNRLLERVFALERHLVPRVALPFGASLLLIGRR
jgi:SAM-dependent methyltransferase